ncbi:MAG: UDP-N-acetylenolpyruvoylglucosamine reductase [Acidobacteria bacterium]|nr:MAG: UDP-N-acetylenolpyruvoylglucosamine reductase [Acidobacteriota bacterium]
MRASERSKRATTRSGVGVPARGRAGGPRGEAPGLSEMRDDFAVRLKRALGDDRVARDAPLAPFTTFKLGGTADWLVLAHRADDVRRALEIARDAGVPVTLLGGGSNVLVSDRGVRGVVIRVHGGDVRQLGVDRIRADAGVTINGLVRWTIAHGCAGLEMWAGTPGTVGGAIFGNAHFRGRLIGELVVQAELASERGEVLSVEAVLSADFRVGRGDAAALRAVARESLAYRKRTQPLESPSAGCIFQNPDPSRDRIPDGIPASAGALVDRAGLKGAREGAARVSMTHANFIVNEGGATATDVRRLIQRCKDGVRARFGVELREEIVFLGFDDGHTAN